MGNTCAGGPGAKNSICLAVGGAGIGGMVPGGGCLIAAEADARADADADAYGGAAAEADAEADADADVSGGAALGSSPKGNGRMRTMLWSSSAK